MRRTQKRNSPRMLTLDEERRLLDWTYQNRNFRDHLAILTILRTGLRTTELRELHVSDISADDEIRTHIPVRAAIAHDQKARFILLPEDLREQLKAFLGWKQKNDEPVDPTSFLFASAKSPQITVRHLQRIVRESTLGALDKPYRVHDLRRIFETRRKKEVTTIFSDAEKPAIESVQPKEGTWQTYGS